MKHSCRTCWEAELQHNCNSLSIFPSKHTNRMISEHPINGLEDLTWKFHKQMKHLYLRNHHSISWFMSTNMGWPSSGFQAGSGNELTTPSLTLWQGALLRPIKVWLFPKYKLILSNETLPTQRIFMLWSLFTKNWGQVTFSMDFPGGSEVKASACNAGDLGLIPGSGRSPGEGNGHPLQYSCLENPMEGGAW